MGGNSDMKKYGLNIIANSVFILDKTQLCSGPASPEHIFNVWTIIMQSLNIKEWNLFELQITNYTM